MVRQGQGAGDGARGDRGEEPLLLLAVPDLPHERRELGEGGEQGAGRHHPAQLLGDDGRLDEGEADAAELLGHGESGPIEGDHGGPELLGLTLLDGGPHDLGGALLLEERTDRVSQLLLIARELELHLLSPSRRLRRRWGAEVGRVYLTPWSDPLKSSVSPRCRRTGADESAEQSRLHSVDAPLAQRQSNGLLIRRFRVQIPRGAPDGTGCPRNVRHLARPTNWAGNVVFGAARLHKPESIDDLRRIVQGSRRIRALGCGHSFSKIADTTGDLVLLDALPKTLQIDRANSTVTVASGTTYTELALELDRAGFALANMASIPRHLDCRGMRDWYTRFWRRSERSRRVSRRDTACRCRRGAG